MTDLFRTGGMSFETWTEVNDLNNAPPEEAERFRTALAALQRNAALTYVLNAMEAEAMSQVYVLPAGSDQLDTAHRDLHAVKRFRAALEAVVQDQQLMLRKTVARSRT